jgi:uncharacterized protein (DUF3820 family)
MLENLTDESIMTFGKHKGEKLANVPDDYLIWIYGEGKMTFKAGVCSEETKRLMKYIEDSFEDLP